MSLRNSAPRPAYQAGLAGGLAPRELKTIMPRFCSLTGHPYTRGLRTLGALRNFEFHLISLFQRFKPLRLNGRVMNEDILTTCHFDKPKPLLIVEPLDSTFRHCNLLSTS